MDPAALAVWEKYIAAAERDLTRDQPLLAIPKDGPALEDLNPEGTAAGGEVPGAYIHHWVGAISVPDATVDSVRAVLEDYRHYPEIYAPDVRTTAASLAPAGADGKVYDVHLVTERNEGMGLHFAFDVRSYVTFRSQGQETHIDTRSYSIRESKGAKAPYTDLMPEGDDHGVLWRLNSYWRLRQSGSSVYADLRVISLSRKPWVGLHDRVKSKAKESLSTTLRQTSVRVARLGSIVP